MNIDYSEIIYTLNESSYSTLNNLLTYIRQIFNIGDMLFYSTVINDDAYVLRGQLSSEILDNIEPVLYPCDHLHSSIENHRITYIKNFHNECEDLKHCPINSLKNPGNSTGCIILPIPFNKEMKNIFPEKEYCGVLFFYANSIPNEIADGELIKLAKIFGELYCQSVLFDKLKIREDIYKHAVKSPDINSYFFRVIELMTKHWNYEAISFFKNDERSKLIRLLKTTGLEQPYQKITDVFYHYKEDHLTVEVAITGKQKILIDPDKNYTSGKYSETVKGRKAACGIFPVLLPPERKYEKQQVVGVLRIINRLFKLYDKEIPTPFTWEDVILCQFICEMSGMITFLIESSTQRSINLERMTHGVLNYITASIRSINQVIERSDFQSYVHPSLKYNLTDTLGNLEAIDWQISKYISPPLTDKSQLMISVNLYGDVLGEVVASAQKVSKSLGVTLKISNLEKAGFKETPSIMGNPLAIKLIFKNLIENAMKYRIGNECEIEITYSDIDSFLEVFVSDKGIGVNENEKEFIFYEGYRSEEAMASNPAGTGFGLFQCSEWMDVMDGKIQLINNKDPTTFKLSFHKFQGERS